jgi:putative cardiolipin synthase
MPAAAQMLYPKQLALLIVLGSLLALGGCATVDFDQPKEASYAAWPADSTYLGRRTAGLGGDTPKRSGFYDLGDGVDALAARYVLARRAERSVDTMYFLIKQDPAGSFFMLSLLEAADRGVRVRVIVDDAERNREKDPMGPALNAHPNVEIRVWNPFSRSVPRWWNAVTDFGRINRRMHNKAFIADNRIAVIGGRNIASEYFGANADVIFADADLGVVGPLVGEVSSMFDEYWNHRLALPLEDFLPVPEDPEAALAKTRAMLLRSRAKLRDGPFARALNRAVSDTVAVKAEQVEWKPYRFIYDNPDKSLKRRPEDLDPLMYPELMEFAGRAEDELIIISPYFVPRKNGMKLFRELRGRDVTVRIITNSLASTNQTLVHTGYAATRKRLLGMGVELYEINPTSKELQESRDEVRSGAGTLHAKLFVVDRKQVFVGTFNFDPRSAYINTEMGVIIDDPEWAAEWARSIDEGIPRSTYEVAMNDRGSLRWTGVVNGEVSTLTKEPETGFWTRFKVNLLRVLPIDDQL